MIMVLRKLVAAREDRMLFAGLIILSANAGGAFSPIGDVTTIMLWVRGMLSTEGVILQVLLPSIASLLIPCLIMHFRFKGELPVMVVENNNPEDKDFSDYENKGFIKKIDCDIHVVDFSCGGAGVGSGTSYVGFFYTADDDMAAVWCAPYSEASLEPSGSGFAWQEENGDNRYYTEHICGHFYYYEASF
jgi:hypothetical protein